ncbi:hypothetical protein AVEN_6504-1 [Araneus ventricosus]|uniref:Uncharacterized protein n=1 Tax=Araneus ventricosus TaxID=182803 RepID=A0A4Y2L624_ARAVE|nr:hypothetical protein AVEN_6504-1 [Araneus ventricosus]
MPKVATINHNWPRQLTQFITAHGPFPEYLKRFGLHSNGSCVCEEIGSLIHYATECYVTASHLLTKTTLATTPSWYKFIVSYAGSIRKIVNLMDFLREREEDLKVQD